MFQQSQEEIIMTNYIKEEQCLYNWNGRTRTRTECKNKWGILKGTNV